MGFGVPLKYWFRGEAADFVRDVLLSQTARERGIFRPLELKRLVDVHSQTGRDMSTQMWAILFFELWCQHWLDPSVGSNPATPEVTLQETHAGSHRSATH